jgi:hypothetical protein
MKSGEDPSESTADIPDQRSTVMDFLTAVTDVEAKVVDTVKSLKKPLVGYVGKGVEFMDGRIPQVTYPAALPEPVELLDSQYKFITALLAAEHDLLKAVVRTVAPLVGAGAKPKPKAAKATKAAA